MGVGRIIFNAILGPLMIWGILLGITVGWHFLQDPPALSIQDFPAETPKEVKDAVIKNRKPLIKDVMSTFQVNCKYSSECTV